MGQCASFLVSSLLHILKLKTRFPLLKANDYSSHGGTDKFAGLPFEIIFDIFSRLPMGTLIRSKSVCKLWYYVIRDPDFIDFHLTKWMHNPPLCFIRAVSGKIFEMEEPMEFARWRNRKIKVEILPWKFLSPILYGSCNGLICMGLNGNRNSIIVCNPIIGEKMCLPKSKFPKLLSSNLTIGFGFDHATKKYKVLRILSCYNKNYHLQLLGEVITLGESSWRKLDIPATVRRYPNIHECPMLHMNGLLYWITGQFVLVFEVGSEKFCTIYNFPFLGRQFNSGLGIFHGSLELIIKYRMIPSEMRIVGSMATGFSFKDIFYDFPEDAEPRESRRARSIQDQVLFMPSFVSLNDMY